MFTGWAERPRMLTTGLVTTEVKQRRPPSLTTVLEASQCGAFLFLNSVKLHLHPPFVKLGHFVLRLHAHAASVIVRGSVMASTSSAIAFWRCFRAVTL